MTGKEKLYFLLDAIDDAKTITPSGQHLAISAADDLNRKLSAIELSLMFVKLEKDEKVIKLLQNPNRIRNAIFQKYDQYQQMDDGRYHIEILSTFDNYFLKIQHEQEYQEFTGKKPIPGQNSKTEIPVRVFTSDLQTKYEEIQREKGDTNFYLKVAGYGKCLNDSEIASPILSQLYEESQSQINLLKISWISFFESWKKYAKDLIDTADTIGVKDEGPLQNEIEEVRSFLNQPEPQFSDTDLPRYYYSYREIVLRFDKLGKKNLITENHLDKNGNIKLFPEYNKVEMEWDKYKRIREISNWWAHYQVLRLAYGIMGNQEEKTHYFKDDNEVDKLYKFEFEEISRNPSYSPVIINRRKFEEWVTRLHNYIIPRLKEITKEAGQGKSPNITPAPQTSNKTLISPVATFDDKEPAILIGEARIPIPPFQNEHYFCRAMFKKKVRSAVDWSIIYEKIQENYHSEYGKPSKTRDNWRPIYDTMIRINNRIKSELNITNDLFSWKDLTLKRNF